MKKINLIERLLSYSHEKQSPQRFVRYAAMLIMLLTLGVGQMWAWTISSAKVYFDNTNSGYDCGVRFVIEKSDGCCVQSMSLISGTNNLYYWSGTWGDGAVSNLRFASDDYTTGWYGWWNNVPNFGSLASAESFCSYTNTYGVSIESASKLFYAASGSSGANLTKTDLTDYSSLNYTQTLYQCVAENGGTPAKSTTSIGTISIATKYLSSASSTSNHNASISSGNNSCNTTAARTATVTMTATSIASGYTFLGWYDSETGGTRLENSTTYTYQATGAKTVYARFSHETTHTVTIYYKCGSTAVSSQTSQAIGQVTASSITAPTVYGYTFTGWTLNTGISNQSASTSVNPISVKTLSSGTYNMTANYTEDLSSTWYVSGASGIFGGWGSSGKNMQRKTGYSTQKKFYYTIDATKVINGDVSDSDFEFKIYNSTGDSYRGNSGYWVTRSNYQPTLSSSSGNNMQFRPDAYGTYEFKVDCESPYSESAPKLTVTFGTKRQVNFGKRTGCNTVTAKYNNSVSMTSGQYVIDGSSVTFSQTANEGYTFEGWYNAASGGTRQSTSASYTLTISGGNKTIYPNYTINNHAITHSASSNGTYTIKVGSAAAVSTNTTADYNQTITLAADPDDGYHFTGWTVTKKGGGSVTVTSNQFTMPDDDVTVSATFAPNNYTITLNDNEGSGGVGSATVTFDHDNFAFASSFVAPTRTGYIFQGYYTSSSMDVGDQLIDKDGNWQSDTEPYTYINEDGNWIYPNDMTLYAGWTPISFTIHYDANGGTGSMDDQTALYEVESSLDGQNSFISTNGFTAPTGYAIYLPAHPWNTSADGTGTDIDAATYQSTLTSTNGATVNLYAQWSGRFALKANYDGGVDGYFRVHYNTSIIEALTTLYPTRYGYLCDGYYTADEDGTKVLNGDGTVVEGNVSGYVTGGKWTYKGTQDFYAHWNQIKYNLAFDGNDCAAYVGEATGSKASMANVEYETDVDITAGTLAREGYTFAGWSKTACATTASYVGSTTRHISSTDGDNVTLYAVWNAKNYTISFNALGGDCYSTSKSVAMGANYGSLPTAYGKSGYEFVGWYTRPEGGTLVTEETQMVTASDHTLYAHYEKKERVYFKNTLGWESVYVTWDAEWNHGGSDKGAGASGKTQELMNHFYGTDIWYKDVPAAILSSWKGNIAFTNIAMDDYEWFDDGQAVYRRDFDSDATMFVPTPNDPNKYTKNKHDAKPGTVYYSTDMIVDKDKDQNVTNYRYKNGYWVRYDELQSGYTVKGSWAWDDDHYVERHSLNDSTYVFTIRNLAANTDYWFNLYKHCTTSNSYSSVFKPNADMTSASSDVVFSAQYAGGGDRKMTTTVAGDYTFKFVFSALGEIRLTIEYPLAVNDYRVVYSYTKGGAQTFASEYIKAKADAVDTISMFIHSADSATARSLYIQKCTTLVAGVPTWNTTYSAITLPSETASGKTSGVYNFRIAQNGSAVATGESIGKYEGNYYIRTDSAAGGWDFYKEYPANQMTYSEYSLSQTLSAPYSHYYCQYVGNSSTDISYTIATDYSPAICPVLTGDATIGMGNKTLYDGKPASVRFTYNEETNETFRAYLKSAQGDGNTRYLLIHGAEDDMIFNSAGAVIADSVGKSMYANELLFKDTENWVYELAIKAKPGAQVSIIAQYNDIDRYLVGDVDSYETIINGETSTTKYNIAAVYDFKTNRLITTWIPDGTISEDITEVDVMIERQYQGGGTTITFGKASEEAKAGTISAKRVIGALKFDYNDLVGKVANWTPATRAKMMFFLSFPFDVNVSDIFGLNSSYGQAFIVQKYNGALRAEKGFFLGDGTTSFWEILPVDSVMHANVGYVVTMDNDYLNGDVGHVWDNKKLGDHVYLYFPSANDPEEPIVISSDPKTIKIPAHECKIDRTFGKLNHKYTDSNWNLMGVPIFQNHTGNATEGTPGAIFTASEEPSDTTSYIDNPDLGYFYQWGTDKNYTIRSAVGFTFLPMHCYMVQYAGDVKFTCAEPSVVPASVAARRTPMTENYNIELQVLNSNDEMLNHTYVELRENAIDTFAVNEDTYMLSNSKDVNVYTFAGAYDVAANVLSIGSHVVPVGVIVNRAGTYTFSMPSNFSGSVTLVDKFAQTRTNLNIEDYEVYLETGTVDDRFELEININKVPTAIDGVEASQGSLKDGKAHKFIMNDMMYILKDGVLYDARGNRVK